jgi:hypothetical protein
MIIYAEALGMERFIASSFVDVIAIEWAKGEGCIHTGWIWISRIRRKWRRCRSYRCAEND